MKPRLFVGSSKKGLKIASAMQENLFREFEVIPWNQGVFELTQSTLESLMEILNSIDMASFIFIPEDILHLENKETLTIRDNVIFELGLFLGKLGRNKVSFVVPESAREFHLPTDLLGITHGIYDDSATIVNASIVTYCNQIRRMAEKYLKIEFPTKGHFGLNILNESITSTDQKENSIVAQIPKGKSVKINFIKLDVKEDSGWGFSVSYIKDWKINNERSERVYQNLVSLGENPSASISFHGKGRILLEYNEVISGELLFSKEFSWNVS